MYAAHTRVNQWLPMEKLTILYASIRGVRVWCVRTFSLGLMYFTYFDVKTRVITRQPSNSATNYLLKALNVHTYCMLYVLALNVHTYCMLYVLALNVHIYCVLCILARNNST